MRRLLAHSARHQLGLTPAHLILGASADEIDAILGARSGLGAQSGDRVAAE